MKVIAALAQNACGLMANVLTVDTWSCRAGDGSNCGFIVPNGIST